MSEIVITTLAERPELLEHLYDLADSWPEFMKHDPVANSLLGQIPPTFPEYAVVATLDGEVIARGCRCRSRSRRSDGRSCRTTAGTR